MIYNEGCQRSALSPTARGTTPRAGSVSLFGRRMIFTIDRLAPIFPPGLRLRTHPTPSLRCRERHDRRVGVVA